MGQLVAAGFFDVILAVVWKFVVFDFRMEVDVVVSVIFVVVLFVVNVVVPVAPVVVPDLVVGRRRSSRCPRRRGTGLTTPVRGRRPEVFLNTRLSASFYRTTWVSRYQKLCKTSLDFNEGLWNGSGICRLLVASVSLQNGRAV